jgi:hypothetical protein
MFEKLGLKEIASLISVMGESYGSGPIIGEIEYDGKHYTYDKEDDLMIITCDDGKKMSIKLNCKNERVKENDREVIYCEHSVDVDFYKEDGSRINLYNRISTPEIGYEGFEGVQRHDLLGNNEHRKLDINRINACGKKEARFDVNMTSVTIGEDYNKYEFTDKGIEHNNTLISLDGEELVTMYGSKVPDRNLVDTFNSEQEKDKVATLAYEMNLHTFTSSIVKRAIEQIDLKEDFVKDVREFYKNGIKEVRNAIKLRSETQDDIEKCIMNPEALEAISSNVRNEYLRTRKVKSL